MGISTLQIPPPIVDTLQLDASLHTVFIKFTSGQHCEAIIAQHHGSAKFQHANGVVSDVALGHAELGYRTLRVFCLPREMPHDVVRARLQSYGVVKEVTDETWSTAYQYRVKNGIRAVKIDLKSHIPSYVTIGGYRAQITYDGQLQTCSICNGTDHFRAECSAKRIAQLPLADPTNTSFSVFPSLPRSITRPPLISSQSAVTPSPSQVHTEAEILTAPPPPPTPTTLPESAISPATLSTAVIDETDTAELVSQESAAPAAMEVVAAVPTPEPRKRPISPPEGKALQQKKNASGSGTRVRRSRSRASKTHKLNLETRRHAHSCRCYTNATTCQSPPRLDASTSRRFLER